MDLADVAAIVFTIIVAGVIAFQIALALGVPWGAYAMGGAFPGRFPPAMRVLAIVQAVILGLMAAIVLSRAGLAFAAWSEAAAWLIWGVVAVAALGIVLNAISRSAGERRVWLPVTIVLLTCSLVVALGAS